MTQQFITMSLAVAECIVHNRAVSWLRYSTGIPVGEAVELEVELIVL